MAMSKILVIGGTGYIGKFVALAAASLHHPTYILVRPAKLSSKAELISSFKASGITILEGSLDDHDSLVAAIKQVDVVISTVGDAQIPDQTKIISAIKEAGTIKRFFPSEFGIDNERQKALEPVMSYCKRCAKIRRAVEESQIPYTYVVCNWFAALFAANLFQIGSTCPPRDKVKIYGSGNVKTICVLEDDVAMYTLKAVDDPRTLNKCLHVRPPANILTQNEMVALWEKAIGKTLEKEFPPQQTLVKLIEDTPYPGSLNPAIVDLALIKGDPCKFDLGPGDVDACTLYPEVKYTSIEDYLKKFV